MSMMEIITPARPGQRNFGHRCFLLSEASHAVRQRSILSGDDFKGWRLSQLMRDANTCTQVDLAEEEYGVWLQDPSHHDQERALSNT
jgi:hypothetical protein